jgi:hypothetical protein
VKGYVVKPYRTSLEEVMWALQTPALGITTRAGKVVQILYNSLTCYNSRAHGHEWSPGSFLISGF